ncbi:toll/interleukin-1 receptor domain-containing protein [Aquimarina hainanensis]|uniref:Toll/interleukin-1 receptor domain-containing protein n=1 Tax=Aquimarina hainanensis TaxID=1578017 RepID=A0ABW5NGK5_9FLAO
MCTGTHIQLLANIKNKMLEFHLDKEYQDIIDKEQLPIGNYSYETFLGADIIFEKNKKTGLWDTKVYARIRHTALERLMIISSLGSIKRMENMWYADHSSPFSVNGPLLLKELHLNDEKSKEVAESVMCDLRDSFHYTIEANYLLEKGYLTLDDLRELAKYYQEVSVINPMLFQFLSAVAVTRKNGGSVSYFNDILVSLKRYELLKIIDVHEEIINNNEITNADIRKTFNLLYPDLENVTKILKLTSEMVLENNDHSKNEYHVALSFAGEDRNIAKKFADALTISGFKVFYDEYEQSKLWGKDLYSHLSEVYGKRAKYCLMIISKSYSEKLWTNHERKSAQAKAFEQSREYILPLRLDETKIDGVNSTVGYIDYHKVGFDETLSLLKQKLAEE